MEDFPCDPPVPAEIGDTWICPDCARKFHYILITLDDDDFEIEAWYTNEIG